MGGNSREAERKQTFLERKELNDVGIFERSV